MFYLCVFPQTAQATTTTTTTTNIYKDEVFISLIYFLRYYPFHFHYDNHIREILPVK